MNFSVGCIRRVTRTHTGVRQQVVTDICSARGHWCPYQPFPSSLNFHTHLAFPPFSGLTPSSLFPSVSVAAWSHSAGLSADAEEGEKMRVKQFFFFFLMVSHLVPAGLQHQR